METACELRRRGLANGDGEEIARLIDQLTALPQLLAALMDIWDDARFYSDEKQLRQAVLDHASWGLEHAGYEFSYFDNDTSRLNAMRERLRGERP
jgi:hypothetical protein